MIHLATLCHSGAKALSKHAIIISKPETTIYKLVSFIKNIKKKKKKKKKKYLDIKNSQSS